MLPSTPRRVAPLWETAVLGGSFVLLWAWFLAYQRSRQVPDGTLWPGWHVLLGVALFLLVLVTVRRLKRLRQALHDPPTFSSGPPGFHGEGNGHN